MEPADRFRLLAGVALADGRLDRAERDVLARCASRLGLPARLSTEILEELEQGGKVRNITPPADPAERAALFDQLVAVVLADQVVTGEEERCLRRLAQGFGVPPERLPSLLQGMLGAGQAQVPPPPPPQVVLAPPPPMPVAALAMAQEAAQVAASPRPQVAGKLKPPPKPGEAGCPSCGASVPFRNARSVARVCEYCDTTVVREGSEQALQDLGHISHVVPDASPIQLGATGRVFGVPFEVLGRLQVVHERGYWNEWYLQWNDGRTGWLGEALGEYQVTFPDTSDGSHAERLPAFEALRPGQRVQLARKRWIVTDVRVARATGTEGETPFAAGEGYELPYADLRRSDDGFATIDYSEEKPLLFVGRSVSWGDLELKGYRTFDGW